MFSKLAEKELHIDFRAIEPKLKIIFFDLEKQNILHNMIFVFLASTYHQFLGGFPLIFRSQIIHISTAPNRISKPWRL